ncbi:hypothetical protein [Wenling dimarhabdovirus 8]|uniref:Uncharacterized protein n=1 Tax=Wenling dimarhabdovirus 8 TaxID=2116361 RepID=A0A2P1GMS6_9RHAB|nr:hypothetical protein [Wenling dimarhabdovirus 8]
MPRRNRNRRRSRLRQNRSAMSEIETSSERSSQWSEESLSEGIHSLPMPRGSSSRSEQYQEEETSLRLHDVPSTVEASSLSGLSESEDSQSEYRRIDRAQPPLHVESAWNAHQFLKDGDYEDVLPSAPVEDLAGCYVTTDYMRSYGLPFKPCDLSSPPAYPDIKYTGSISCNFDMTMNITGIRTQLSPWDIPKMLQHLLNPNQRWASVYQMILWSFLLSSPTISRQGDTWKVKYQENIKWDVIGLSVSPGKFVKSLSGGKNLILRHEVVAMKSSGLLSITLPDNGDREGTVELLRMCPVAVLKDHNIDVVDRAGLSLIFRPDRHIESYANKLSSLIKSWCPQLRRKAIRENRKKPQAQKEGSDIISLVDESDRHSDDSSSASD